jgi:putative peptidoglycan lipid II flippase
VLLAPRLGIYGMAWGVVIGALLHLLVQLPALPGLPHARYTLTLGRGMPLVGQVFRLMGPRLISVAVVQLNFLLNTTLASLQPAGSLTGISLAFPLMIMPQAAIAQSVAIAALPTFSAQAATGQRAEMRAAQAAILRGVLLLAVPASLGLVLLRRPIVALIYQRGAFTAASTELVAWALLFYGLGLVGHSLVEIVTRAFFALQDTRTPTLLTTLAMVFNLVFSLLFSLLFSRLGWMPHGGLALANSLATALEAAGLLVLMRRRLDGLDGARSWRAAAQAGLAALGMGLTLAVWLALTGGAPLVVKALGGVAVGAGVYFAVLLLLRVPEAQWIVSLAARRLR